MRSIPCTGACDVQGLAVLVRRFSATRRPQCGQGPLHGALVVLVNRVPIFRSVMAQSPLVSFVVQGHTTSTRVCRSVSPAGRLVKWSQAACFASLSVSPAGAKYVRVK